MGETLDELWRQAEQLGCPEVKKESGRGEYRASINFSTPNGSNIYANGKGTDPRSALRAAIDEARSLRAGYEFAAAS